MDWGLKFISKEDLKAHVKATINKYGKKLNSFDLKKFNSNLVDPIKLIFDKSVYHVTWEEIINSEIIRQRDKSNTNDIGYFHQNIFTYFEGCDVPEKGWDVVFKNPNGVTLPDGDVVSKVFVEMKNKHNTMNSAAAGKTYIKMQHQLLADDDCACFLVEAIASRTQNIKWDTTVDGTKVGHKRIRRVSMDQFYSIVTGDEKAFYKLCMVLPGIITEVVDEGDSIEIPEDTVITELRKVSGLYKDMPCDLAMAMAVYMLGFSTYSGFSDSASSFEYENEPMTLNRIYEYGKYMGEEIKTD